MANVKVTFGGEYFIFQFLERRFHDNEIISKKFQI